MSILDQVENARPTEASTTGAPATGLNVLLADFEGILEPLEAKGVKTSEYYIKKTIGRGAYGVAILVEDAALRQDFVAKVMDLRTMSQKDRTFALSEVRCLAKCSHPNIIRLKETHERNGRLLLIMEYANGGDLGKQIIARSAQGLFYKETEILFIFLQLCLALDYLHQKRMMHRDLKTANVFLTSNGLIKLGDFGFSRQYEDTLSEDVGNTFCGTPYYVAPELWRRQPYSKKAEMWSLGVILYEIVTLKRPFYDKTIKLLVPKVLNGEYQPIENKNCNNFIIQTCNALLTQDPEHRPSIREILSTSYMQQSLQLLVRSVQHNTFIDAATRQSMCHSIEIILQDSQRCTPSPRVTRSGEVMFLQAGKWVNAILNVGEEGVRVVVKDSGFILQVSIEQYDQACLGERSESVPIVFYVLTTNPEKEKLAFTTQNETDAHEWIHALNKCK
eukprot:PhF_6_TR25373/c0_g1_i1/m.35096/K08857/NEK1_4_5; NIMA (never in mitosis gene a)-related kinase 1/4/5